MVLELKAGLYWGPNFLELAYEMFQVRTVCRKHTATRPLQQTKTRNPGSQLNFAATKLKACLRLVVAHVRLVARIGICLGRLLHFLQHNHSELLH